MDEFKTILNLIRADFKDAGGFFAEADDQDRLFRLIRKHKLGTQVFFFGKNGLRPALRERLEAECAVSLSQFEKACRLASRLECLAAEAGVRFVVVKGIGLNHCIYGAEKIRSFGDLDILARPEDVISLNRVLNENGFFQKAGVTSSAAASSRYGRGFLALHAKKAEKTYGAIPFPIKEHRDKPQYIAYYRQGEPNVEVHDGLYFLSSSVIECLWESAVRIAYEEGSVCVPDTEHNFLLLLTNTYENSESFFSNTYDFGAVLRDYADLRFFFEKHKETLDWARVEKRIDTFDLRNIAKTIIGNLFLVYGRDVTFGCLPSVKAAESEWGLSITERMRDAELCRQTVLAVMRKRWLAQGSLSVLPVPPAGERPTIDDFSRCSDHGEVLFRAEYAQDSFLLSWAIPPALQKECNSLLYQFRFFPLTDADYTSYKLDFGARDGVYVAYGHRTKHHRLFGAVRKETGPAVPVFKFLLGRMLVIGAYLPFRELGISGVPERESICVSAEIYKKHYNDTYHRLDIARTEIPMSLIEII